MQAGLILMNKEKRVDTLEDFMERVQSLPSLEPYEVRHAIMAQLAHDTQHHMHGITCNMQLMLPTVHCHSFPPDKHHPCST